MCFLFRFYRSASMLVSGDENFGGFGVELKPLSRQWKGRDEFGE